MIEKITFRNYCSFHDRTQISKIHFFSVKNSDLRNMEFWSTFQRYIQIGQIIEVGNFSKVKFVKFNEKLADSEHF